MLLQGPRSVRGAIYCRASTGAKMVGRRGARLAAETQSRHEKLSRHFADEDQIYYGNTIVVHPRNPDHVLCGGVDLHLTTNGGRTWRRVTRWDAERGERNYAHGDHHHLVMPASAAGRVYDVNDGGLDVSDDGGFTWNNRSKGLVTTMYYDMDVAQSWRRFGGGTPR